MARETLNREQIVRAAIELLDAEGADGLSMRKLGQRLGSAATAMYWHVGNKDNLLALAAEEVWGEVVLPDVPKVGWRAAARSLMYETRALSERHRWLMPVITKHFAYSEAMARFQECSYEVFEAAGFRDAELDWAVTTAFMYVMGMTSASGTEAAALQDRAARDESTPDEADALARANAIAERFPRLRARLEAIQGMTPSEIADKAFEFGVETVLDGLQARLAARSDAV